jgi:hypothetical protein
MVGCNNPIPFFVTVNPLADFSDFSGNLMAKHQRGLLNPIPFHHIAAANATGFYAHQEFTRAYLGRWDLLYPDVVVLVIHGHTHVSDPPGLATKVIHRPLVYPGKADRVKSPWNCGRLEDEEEWPKKTLGARGFNQLEVFDNVGLNATAP